MTDKPEDEKYCTLKETRRIINAADLTERFDGENKTKWRRRSEARATSTLASRFETI